MTCRGEEGGWDGTWDEMRWDGMGWDGRMGWGRRCSPLVVWYGAVRCRRCGAGGGAVRCSAVRCGMVWYAYGGTVQGMDGMYGIVGHGI